MDIPVLAGYNAVLLLGGSPVFCPSISLQERKAWLESESAYTTIPTAASWKAIAEDATELAGTITADATPALLAEIPTLVDVRSAEQHTVYRGWDVIDAGGDGWKVDKALAESLIIETGEGRLVSVGITLKAYARKDRSSNGWYERSVYDFDQETGTAAGAYAQKVTQAQNQRIAYWETEVESTLTIANGMKGVIQWRLTFNNNYVYSFLCEANSTPQPPAYNPPGSLDVTLDMTLLLTAGVEPPRELTNVAVKVLGRPITLPHVVQVQEAVPVGESNKAVVWEVQYAVIDAGPDFSEFSGFTQPHGGLYLP